jgi:5-(carboxyamino)imidazole ribonucleotide synthase
MSTIWVLGAGQLGAMLHDGASVLNLDVRPIDIESDEQLSIADTDIVTAEREQWPETTATAQLAAHPYFVNKAVFGRLADRLTQKQILDELEIATTPWCPVTLTTKSDALYDRLGSEVLLKRRTGGYDGRGQHWLKQFNRDEIPQDWREASIAEQKIPFEDELSVVGVRNRAGDKVFFPLSLNLHVNGILMGTLAPVQRIAGLQEQGENMLGKLMDSLDYIGVMAMECFSVGGQLMVNEVAPRVHNSGHWSLTGANISQFEYHLRAVADLPIPEAKTKGPSAMVNLIGVDFCERWAEVPGADVYWYDKEVRPGRKVGHINFCNSDLSQLKASLRNLEKLLPENYSEVVSWLTNNID